MVLEGFDLRHINKIVDVYNYISLKHMIPIGGDDMDKVEGDIILRYAKGDERFIQLNSDKMDNPKEGEIVYADDKEILCRRWNWRECDKSKMTSETKNVILVAEGLSPFTKKEVQNIIDELGKMEQEVCGGEVEKYVLNIENTKINI